MKTGGTRAREQDGRSKMAPFNDVNEVKAVTQFSAQGARATSWGSRFLARIKPKEILHRRAKREKTSFRASSSSHPTTKMVGSRFVVGVIFSKIQNVVCKCINE